MTDARNDIDLQEHLSPIGVRIESKRESCSKSEVDSLIPQLDIARGVMLTSRYEYPGRYTRWDIGSIHPPIAIESTGKMISVSALNKRGEVLLEPFERSLANCQYCEVISNDGNAIHARVFDIEADFIEEHRSRTPHVLNVIRHLRHSFEIEDSRLGFYGAFGYDLGIDFMGIEKKLPRNDQRDLVLYLVDQIFITDHAQQESYKISYEFDVLEDDEHIVASTRSFDRVGERVEYIAKDVEATRDMKKGEYARIVESAKDYFARGDLFEVVPSQTFHEPCASSPSIVFNKLLEVNPAPYGALINLGSEEWTISASPEMFVRVDGDYVESCPIAGTIARGSDGITDEEQIKKLLDSEKEASELIMCTDVDRNDKSRVSVPGSVKVIGRRQIEMYSRLIHTVDHVESRLLENLESIDAFLTHTWAVTVTGAPKMWAMKFIEQNEASPRKFYGGAMGFIALDGTMNTGLMLRTIHLHGGQAHIRVGATLLMDSDPAAEEAETELKASAMLDVVRYCHAKATGDQFDELKVGESIITNIINQGQVDSGSKLEEQISNDDVTLKRDVNVLLIDCEDSFVHTLAGYFRIAGAYVETKRIGFSAEDLQADIDRLNPKLICLSPGPGSPTDFELNKVIDIALKNNLPIFGVCLGLQALVEYYGGTLGQLKEPMHGKTSLVKVKSRKSKLFSDIKSPFSAGRYHSLYADAKKLPKDFEVTAQTKGDKVIMAIEHEDLPIAAVQFHPESIMTLENGTGIKIIENVLKNIASD